MSSKSGFVLEVSGLHWLEGGDPGDDLCVHGAAHVRIDGETLVTPSDFDGWTLSAASLYLLRTLFRDHSPDAPVGEHLIPCCGFNMWVDEQGELVILGCASGIDWSVRHTSSGVTLQSPTGQSQVVDGAEWRAAVLKVADTVRAHYQTSPPRHVPTDEHDRRGYERFWVEWKRLRGAAA